MHAVLASGMQLIDTDVLFLLCLIVELESEIKPEAGDEVEARNVQMAK
jgi:hypothetical protein